MSIFVGGGEIDKYLEINLLCFSWLEVNHEHAFLDMIGTFSNLKEKVKEHERKKD